MDNFFGRISEKVPANLVKERERQLIYELVEEGRSPLTVLAKKLRISKDSAQYTLQRLCQKGVILRLAPIVDLEAFGYKTYHAFFVTNDDPKERKIEFINTLTQHPHTKAVMEYTSRWEVEWTVVAKNMQEFDQLLTELTSNFVDVIIEKNKFAIITGYKSTTVAARHPHEEPKLIVYLPDSFDKKILQLLHQDGRSSSYHLAEKINLSANAVRYRIKRMHQAGIIRAFTATVNLNSLGYHLYTVGFILRYLNNEKEAKLKEFLRQERFIIRAVKVLGPWDLIMTILADDLKHFHETVKKIESTFAEIIVSYEALIAYEERLYKYIPEIVFHKK